MLTGRCPSQSHDPLELVHCHIARPPALAARRSSRRARRCSRDIVLKLLAKNAEDRYQSAAGCAPTSSAAGSAWTRTGTIAPFPLGRATTRATAS